MSYIKLLSVLFFLVLVGCVSPGLEVRVTLADGRKLVVAVKDGRVVGEDNKYVRVRTARFMYNTQQKNGAYVFTLGFSPGSIPASVKIEDVSDAKAGLMVHDTKPELKDQFWHYASPPIGLDDPSMKWMHDIDDSFRIYRINVVLKDGTEVTLHHAGIYPSYVKMSLISAFESKAP